MEQHPIPQNVTAYQFRLVGDMTLKQFLELAGGILLAFLTTRFTLIPVFIRWPAAGIFAFGGIALAFLPVEERPLDVWLKNFIRSIYSPTQFLWQKKGLIPDLFAYSPGKTAPEPTKPQVKDQRQLQSYLQTLPQPTQLPVDQQENTTLNRINQFLGATPPVTEPSAQPGLTASPGIKTRKLRTPYQLRQGVVIYEQREEEEKEKEKPLQPPPQQPAPAKPKAAKPAPPHLATYRKRPATPPSLQKQTAPTSPVVEITQPPRPPLTVSSLYPQPAPQTDKDKKRVAPEFAQDLPLPTPPDAPNLVVGMVVGTDDRLVTNAIVEIRNDQNQTVRAVKTNKLGQFFIATPLLDGEYEIRVEHAEYAFDIIKFKAEGKIIPPIKIKAKQKRSPEAGNQEASQA